MTRTRQSLIAGGIVVIAVLIGIVASTSVRAQERVAAVTLAQTAAPVCTPIADGQLRCAIAKISDCAALNDYPYARNLFCPAACSSTQDLVSRVAQTLGVKAPTKGFCYYDHPFRCSSTDDDRLSRYARALPLGQPFRRRCRYPLVPSGRLCDRRATVAEFVAPPRSTISGGDAIRYPPPVRARLARVSPSRSSPRSKTSWSGRRSCASSG